ncbi:MAG: hypothetical protein Q7S40_31180 [Opitutaceae bacterium]|nr:hypothetical protein [Opitutaceae bacterium]
MRAFLILLLASVTATVAAPLQRELGQRLLYHRVTELPADLPATAGPARKQPLVLDLRFVQGKEAAAIATEAWLKFHASARTPVFVLANAETGGELRRMLAGLRRSPGVLVVGRPGRNFEPDVAVQTAAADERRAYDALASGTAVGSLMTDNPEKVRNDEASLSRDRLADASADAATDEIRGKTERPPVDAVLQRAVHLHRALVALRKL